MKVLAFAPVMIAALLSLPIPFGGDQALFTVYGRELSRGALLYRDVFDVKQPGIFWFYQVGGWLFGFTEVGLHVFELIYWLAFTVFAVRALRPYFETRWGPSLVPASTVVVYYLYASLLDVGQIEILVAFPLLLAWWLIDGARPQSRTGVRRYAAAGLAAAAVVLFKYPYLLIVIGFLAYAIVRSWRDGTPISAVRRSVVAFLAGLVCPLLVVAAYFAMHGQLGRIWWAYVGLAPRTGERPLGYLVLGLRRFAIGHGPILILAVLGSVRALKERPRPRSDMVLAMLLWLAIGATAFLVQNWFEYKWLLFTVPLGILAVVGVESLLSMRGPVETRIRSLAWLAGSVLALVTFFAAAGAAHRQTWLLLAVAIGGGVAMVGGWFSLRGRERSGVVSVLWAAVAVSLGLTAIVPAEKVQMLAQHEYALGVAARTELWRSWNPFYRAADRDLRKVGPRLPPGPLGVFGSPLLLLRGDRPPADPFLAMRPEFLDQRAWSELYSHIRATAPHYIVVDAYLGTVVRDRYPPIVRFISSRYSVSFVGDSGTWYVRRESMSSDPEEAAG
jgi:hypothetical protein